MHNARTRLLGVVVALTLVLTAGVAALGVGAGPSSGVAHASATPVMVQSNSFHNYGGSAYSFNEHLPSAITAGTGHRLAVAIALGGGNSYEVGTISDTQGNTFTLVGNQIDGLDDFVEWFDAPITTGGSDDVAVTLTNGTCHGGGSPACTTFVQVAETVIEVSGAAASDSQAGGANNNNSTTSHVCNSTTLATNNDQLDLAEYVDGGANVTLSLTAGESGIAKSDGTVNMEYDVASADAQTSFTFESSAGVPWAAYAAISYPSV